MLDEGAKRWIVEAAPLRGSWHPGEITIAVHTSDGRMEPVSVVGWKRGLFGIWTHHPDIENESVEVATLVHLPSGFGVVIFLDANDAAEAGEIAARLRVDWGKLCVGEDNRTINVEFWQGVADRVQVAWRAAGFAPIARLDDDAGIVWGRILCTECLTDCVSGHA